MSADKGTKNEDESGGGRNAGQSATPHHSKDKGLDQKGGAKTEKDTDPGSREKSKFGCIPNAFKCGDFSLVAFITFATAAGINAIANGDVLFALVSGAVLISAIAARAVISFRGYWQVILGIALVMLSAFFLYAGFYAFSLPPGESWSAWPHLIFSSVLAVAALAAVIHWLSYEDKK